MTWNLIALLDTCWLFSVVFVVVVVAITAVLAVLLLLLLVRLVVIICQKHCWNIASISVVLVYITHRIRNLFNLVTYFYRQILEW